VCRDRRRESPPLANMPPPFTKNDLLMPQTRIDEITDALQNALMTDPIAVVIAEQKQKVDSYTGKYAIGDEWYRSLVRPLVVYELYATGSIGSMPDAVKDAYAAKIKELELIRDGKHPDLAHDDPLPSEVRPSLANWSSNTKLKLPSDEND
jgi:hypothetical protein